MRRAISFISTIAVLAVTPTVATATETAQGGYSSTPIAVPEGPSTGAPTVAGATATKPATAAAPAAASAPTAAASPTVEVSDDSLPFTGMDVGILAAIAVGLMGLGFVLRRTTRVNEA